MSTMPKRAAHQLHINCIQATASNSHRAAQRCNALPRKPGDQINRKPVRREPTALDAVVQNHWTAHLQRTRGVGSSVTHHVRKYFDATRWNIMTGKPRFMSVTSGSWKTFWRCLPGRRETWCELSLEAHGLGRTPEERLPRTARRRVSARHITHESPLG